MTTSETREASPETKPQPPAASGFSDLGALGPVLGLAAAFFLFALLEPRTFLSLDNLQIILMETAVVGTAALGMTVIIISGGIDLSVGSNIALCTVFIAIALSHGFGALASLIVGIASSASVGLLIGLLVTRLKLAPFIVTLGLWGALRGTAKRLSGEAEIFPPVTWLNNLLTMLPADRRWMLVPPGVWLMLVLTGFVAAVLRYTRFGRHVFAIGSNEQTARLCGVPIERTRILIYLFAACFFGIAGVLQFSKLTIGDPTTANGYELNIIAAVVIGGASLSGGEGTVAGTLVGALLMTVVGNGCNKVGLRNSVQDMVTGGIIVAAAALDQFRQRGAKSQ